METHYSWGRICVFCGGHFEAPSDDGWTTQELCLHLYWRCPTCTAAGHTEPHRSGEDDTTGGEA